jgi:cytochrome c-type biogenesis protein CcmH
MGDGRKRVRDWVGAVSIAAFLFAAAALAPAPAYAVQPDEVLANPTEEARARRLSAELRCLVCQNQSIDDSNAPLARDLRLLVRERITAGDSDAEAMRYIVARYGEYVLLRPPVGAHTALLWGTPLLVLFLAGYVLWRWGRTRGPAGSDALPGSSASPSLTAEEEARLAKLVDAAASGVPRTERQP